MPTSDLLEARAGTSELSLESTQCRNCGAYVSSRFARVFGDNDDEVHRCIECSTLRDLQQGAGTGQLH